MQSVHARLVTLALALCLGCLTPRAVFAQDAFNLMLKLHLTAAQQKKMQQINLKNRPELLKDAAAMQANPRDAAARQHFKAANDRQLNEIAAMLNPTQRQLWNQEMPQIQRQNEQLRERRRIQMQLLNLTPTQSKKIAQINERSFSELRKIGDTLKGRPRDAAAQLRFNAVVERREAQIRAILTPTQRKIWSKVETTH